jgi:hypothetical protein
MRQHLGNVATGGQRLGGLAIDIGDGDDLSLRQAEGQRFRVDPADAPCADNSDVQLLCAQCVPLDAFHKLFALKQTTKWFAESIDSGFNDPCKRNVLAPSLRDSGVNLWNPLSPR